MTDELKHEIEPEGGTQPVAVDTWMPSVYLDVSKEQLEALEVGNQVTITLRGKVKGLQAMENSHDSNRYEVNLELKEVVIDPKENEFTKLAEDD